MPLENSKVPKVSESYNKRYNYRSSVSRYRFQNIKGDFCCAYRWKQPLRLISKMLIIKLSKFMRILNIIYRLIGALG